MKCNYKNAITLVNFMQKPLWNHAVEFAGSTCRSTNFREKNVIEEALWSAGCKADSSNKIE